MIHTTTIEFEHTKGNDLLDDDSELCVETIEIQLAYEPADPDVGIMNEYWWLDDAPPKRCFECGHTYSDDERNQINALMEKAAYDYEGTRYDY